MTTVEPCCKECGHTVSQREAAFHAGLCWWCWNRSQQEAEFHDLGRLFLQSPDERVLVTALERLRQLAAKFDLS
jgi:hypothetical protein